MINTTKEEDMEKTREVKQVALCKCENRCDGGEVIPYPLSSTDLLSDNIVDDYCKSCRFLSWQNLSEA